jgi:hypothetical protein
MEGRCACSRARLRNGFGIGAVGTDGDGLSTGNGSAVLCKPLRYRRANAT